MKHQPLLLQSIRLADRPEPVDVLIKDGVFYEIAAKISAPDGVQTLDGCGKLLVSSFIDCHTHVDKALIGSDIKVTGLMDAVEATLHYQKALPKDKVGEDVLRRGRQLLDRELARGTGTLRTHVSLDDIWGLEAFFACCELRTEYADRLELQLTVPIKRTYLAELTEAARKGQIDFIAGYPSVFPDWRKEVDELFELSEQLALPLDLHVDESDDPDVSCFSYIIEKTLRHGLTGKVNCSHVTALAAATDEVAEEVIQRCALADVSVIALPSCNMYLMGRHDRGLVRRGITRIKELEEAGVNVAIASDNIRDPFRPFGNGDLLEEIQFACQVLSRGTRDEILSVFNMATINAAKTSLIQNYGILPGAQADCVLLDATDLKQAVLDKADRLLVVKRGRIVCG